MRPEAPITAIVASRDVDARRLVDAAVGMEAGAKAEAPETARNKSDAERRMLYLFADVIVADKCGDLL